MNGLEHWDAYWQEALDDQLQRHPEFDPEDYYVSGRASKLWPKKETPEWWAENGPKFVKSWEHWRVNCGMKLWEHPNEETGELAPGIEVECWAYGPKYMDRDGIEIPGTQLIVRSIIDRVFVDDAGDLRIVDLKTGSSTPAWPQQLALNNLCLKYQYGVSARYGGFWKARQGGVPKWHDLTIYTDEFLWDTVWKAKQIRDRQLFIPHPNNLCTSACGVSQFCLAMGGTPPVLEIPTYDATMTQTPEEEE